MKECQKKVKNILAICWGMQVAVTAAGGVILYDETINQLSSSGKKIPNLISDKGAVPGIKVDTGAKVLANSAEEKITEGLDG